MATDGDDDDGKAVKIQWGGNLGESCRCEEEEDGAEEEVTEKGETDEDEGITRDLLPRAKNRVQNLPRRRFNSLLNWKARRAVSEDSEGKSDENALDVKGE